MDDHSFKSLDFSVTVDLKILALPRVAWRPGESHVTRSIALQDQPSWLPCYVCLVPLFDRVPCASVPPCARVCDCKFVRARVSAQTLACVAILVAAETASFSKVASFPPFHPSPFIFHHHQQGLSYIRCPAGCPGNWDFFPLPLHRLLPFYQDKLENFDLTKTFIGQSPH